MRPTEMEERVAREMYYAQIALCKSPSPIWEDFTKLQQDVWLMLARTAIRAMRDCTEQMVATAQERYQADLNGVGRTIIGCLWLAMIDAASPPEPD